MGRSGDGGCSDRTSRAATPTAATMNDENDDAAWPLSTQLDSSRVDSIAFHSKDAARDVVVLAHDPDRRDVPRVRVRRPEDHVAVRLDDAQVRDRRRHRRRRRRDGRWPVRRRRRRVGGRHVRRDGGRDGRRHLRRFARRRARRHARRHHRRRHGVLCGARQTEEVDSDVHGGGGGVWWRLGGPPRRATASSAVGVSGGRWAL